MTSRPSIVYNNPRTIILTWDRIFDIVSSKFYCITRTQETDFISPHTGLENGGYGGDEQALQQTYSPKGSASCVQSFDDSLVLQFA